MVEIRQDDLAFLIEAGLDAAWKSAPWPGAPATVSESMLDALEKKGRQFLYDVAIAKRRIQAARLILRSLFPEEEKYQDEFWFGLSVLEEPQVGEPPCCKSGD